MTHPRESRACHLRPSYMSHGRHDSAANSKEGATTRDSRRKDGSWRCQEPGGTFHGPGRLSSPKEEGTSERWRWPRVTQPTWGKEARSLRCQPSATPRLEGGRSEGGGQPGLQPLQAGARPSSHLQPPTCLHLHSQCPLAPGLPTAQPDLSTRELQSSVLGQTLEAARTGPHHGLSPATTWTLDTQSRLASPPGPSSDRNEASLLLTTEGEVGGATGRGCTPGAGTNPGPSVRMESGGPGGQTLAQPPPPTSQLPARTQHLLLKSRQGNHTCSSPGCSPKPLISSNCVSARQQLKPGGTCGGPTAWPCCAAHGSSVPRLWGVSSHRPPPSQIVSVPT